MPDHFQNLERLRANAAIREHAERMAMRFVPAMVESMDNGNETVWSTLGDDYRHWHVEAQLRLILSGDPASMDALARILAKALGLECGATAPGWYRSRIHHGTRGGVWACWRLRADQNVVEFHDMPGRSSGVMVPGISTISDPFEAICACLVAVLS